MIEAVWQERKYLVFERDLNERAESVRLTEDPPKRVWAL
jgi:hypothetical protein